MVIADLRRINLRLGNQQYYPITAASIYDITRWIMGLVNMYPGLPLKVTKRDVASALRLLRLHPSLSLVMVTDFTAGHVHLQADLVCFYLSMPFGWNGAPSHFSFFGDEFPHGSCAMWFESGIHFDATLL